MPGIELECSWPIGGKTALVTGAAKRIGRAIAVALAQNGANVVLHYRTSEAEVQETAAVVREHGGRAWVVPADFTISGEAAGYFDRVVDAAGPINILVNSASIFPESELASVDVADIMGTLEVNALSPFVLSRKFAEQEREGVIVNLLDTRIADYDRRHVAYQLSKQMLSTLTRMMAVEFAPRIRVNAVAPGLILPPDGKGLDYLEGLKGTNPLNQYGSAEDVSAAAVFLIGSGFVTGQVIHVDGGRHLKGMKDEG